MAWIESHQELARHPKTRKLARLLGVSVPCAIGHLHLLWWWAVDYAESGVLDKYTAEDVADAMLWDGEAQLLWDGMLQARFIDKTSTGAVIHDWPEYAGRLIEQRRKDAERKRLSRTNPPDVHRTDGGQPSDVHTPSGVTVPNLTVPNLTGDAAAAAVTPRLENSPRARARGGGGGLRRLNGFLSQTTAAAATSFADLPDEVRERLSKPPIGDTHADG